MGCTVLPKAMLCHAVLCCAVLCCAVLCCDLLRELLPMMGSEDVQSDGCQRGLVQCGKRCCTALPDQVVPEIQIQDFQ